MCPFVVRERVRRPERRQRHAALNRSDTKWQGGGGCGSTLLTGEGESTSTHGHGMVQLLHYIFIYIRHLVAGRFYPKCNTGTFLNMGDPMVKSNH